MSQEVKLDPLKRDEVDMAWKIISKNHPLQNISLFKALPFLHYITFRFLWHREEEIPYVQMDERKILKFHQLKNTSEVQHLNNDENAEIIKKKLLRAWTSIMDEIKKDDPKIAEEIESEQRKIDEEVKEVEVGKLMLKGAKRGQRYDDENKDQFEDDEEEEEEEIFASPILREKPFLYLGFGINLYFDLLLVLILTMIVIWILFIPVYKILNKGLNYEQGTWSTYSLGNFGYSSATCSSSSLIVDGFIAQWSSGQIASLKHLELHPGNSTVKNACLPSEDTDICAGSLNKEKFSSYFDQNCINKTHCSITGFMKNYVRPGNNTWYHPDAVGFFQYSWLQTSSQITTKRQEALFIVWVNIFCGLLLFIILRFFRVKTEIEFKEWDMDTVTVSDYAAEFHVKEKMYQNFKTEYEGKIQRGEIVGKTLNNYSVIYEFKVAFSKALEEQIKAMPAIHKQLQNVNIWNIYFSFDNKEIIDWLSRRGDALRYGEILKAKQIDDEIKSIKEKLNENERKPWTAYVIFEEEEAWQRALKAPPKSIKFWNKSVNFTKASEPSDVIWENKHQSRKAYLCKALIAAVAVGLLLSITFIWVFLLKTSYTQSHYGGMNWESVYKVYSDPDTLLKYAMKESFVYFKKGIKTTLDGALKCFWEQEWTNNGYYSTIKKKYSSPSVLEENGKPYQNDICFDYLADTYWSSIVIRTLGIVIVMTNYFARFFVVKIITWIGYKTQSSLNRAYTNVIFVTQFFNSAIILLLIDSNFTETGIPFLGLIFKGNYYDFDSDWYKNMGGTIEYTVAYIAVWPIIEFAVYYGIKVLMRLLDWRTLCKDKYKTRKTTIQQYVDLYGGPDYLIYWKYSSIINLMWITFMFGPGLPILYPTWLFGLIILWVIERLCMAYYYKQPPMYDDLLSNNAINLLRYSILLQMAFGYWMFSNKQMFNNEVFTVSEANSPMRSEHSIWDPIEFNQAFPFLMIVAIFVVYMIGYYIYSFIMSFREKEDKFQNLPTFMDSLKDSDRQWLISEEEYIREKNNYKILSDEFYRHLVTFNMIRVPTALNNRTFIQNVASYDILANPYYEEKFQYYCAKNRGDLDSKLFMSEKVRQLLFLPYLSKDQARILEFKNELFNILGKKVRNTIYLLDYRRSK